MLHTCILISSICIHFSCLSRCFFQSQSIRLETSRSVTAVSRSVPTTISLSSALMTNSVKTSVGAMLPSALIAHTAKSSSQIGSMSIEAFRQHYLRAHSPDDTKAHTTKQLCNRTISDLEGSTRLFQPKSAGCA